MPLKNQNSSKSGQLFHLPQSKGKGGARVGWDGYNKVVAPQMGVAAGAGAAARKKASVSFSRDIILR